MKNEGSKYLTIDFILQYFISCTQTCVFLNLFFKIVVYNYSNTSITIKVDLIFKEKRKILKSNL